MNRDWRLNGQDSYLYGVSLYNGRFHFEESNEIDHAHCEFCWAKFSENEGDLHAGYITEDYKYVICDQCFEDFQEQFKWKVINMLD